MYFFLLGFLSKLTSFVNDRPRESALQFLFIEDKRETFFEKPNFGVWCPFGLCKITGMTSVYQSIKCTSTYILITQSLCDFCFIKDGHLMYVRMFLQTNERKSKLIFKIPLCPYMHSIDWCRAKSRLARTTVTCSEG